MGRTGKDSLKRKILNVDPRKVQLHDALEAKKLVAPFSVESIQEISIGLALFYIFVSNLTILFRFKVVVISLINMPKIVCGEIDLYSTECSWILSNTLTLTHRSLSQP